MIANWISQGKPTPDETFKPQTALDAAIKGVEYFQMLQCEDGHWAGDYGGPHFLTPGLVIMWYVTGRDDNVLPRWRREAITHYIQCHQQADGGWGTHVEVPSTMFGSVMNYIALRLLGMTSTHECAITGREYIKKGGGALYTSSWAKFYLCLLGVMEWEGHNSIPPEMFLLPDWFPFHPSRLWCHCRMVYLPMSYLYGRQFVYTDAETDILIQCLRDEIYCQSYHSINWTRTRRLIAETDNYSPIPWTMKLAQDALVWWECYGGRLRRCLRNRGLEFALEYIHAEDVQTNFINIGPVNKILNMISVFDASGSGSQRFQNHVARISDYLWVAEDGMKMQGYNGSQCWDTSFFAQSVCEGALAEKFPKMSQKIYSFLRNTQILSTPTARASDGTSLCKRTTSQSQAHQFFYHKIFCFVLFCFVLFVCFSV
jgi:squalene/oxidosqualene cyclase-like protein